MKINFYFDVVLWYQIAIDVLMVGIICNIYVCNVTIQNKFVWEIEIYFVVKKKNKNFSISGKNMFLMGINF